MKIILKETFILGLASRKSARKLWIFWIRSMAEERDWTGPKPALVMPRMIAAVTTPMLLLCFERGLDQKNQRNIRIPHVIGICPGNTNSNNTHELCLLKLKWCHFVCRRRRRKWYVKFHREIICSSPEMDENVFFFHRRKLPLSVTIIEVRTEWVEEEFSIFDMLDLNQSKSNGMDAMANAFEDRNLVGSMWEGRIMCDKESSIWPWGWVWGGICSALMVDDDDVLEESSKAFEVWFDDISISYSMR